MTAQIVMIENDLNVLLGARWDIGIHCEDWSAQDCADYYASLFNNLISVSASDIESAYNLLLSDPCYYVKYGCGYMNTRNVIESMREAHPDATEQEIFAAYLESMPVTFEMIEANMDTVLAEN